MRAHTQLPPEGPTSNTITLWGRVLTREPEARGHRHSAFKIIWAPLSLLNFHAAFRTCLSISSKNHSLLMMFFFQIYRLIQKEFTLRKCEVFLSMKIIYFSIYLDLSFLSAWFCHFQQRCPASFYKIYYSVIYEYPVAMKKVFFYFRSNIPLVLQKNIIYFYVLKFYRAVSLSLLTNSRSSFQIHSNVIYRQSFTAFTVALAFVLYMHVIYICRFSLILFLVLILLLIITPSQN